MSALVAAVVVALLSAPAPIPAQQWSAEQQAVWSMIEEAWRLDMNEEDWVTPYMHDDGVGWGSDIPSPRGKESIGRWSRFGDETTESLELELFPLTIIVHGDMAVVHYFSSWAQRDANGEMSTQHFKQTDIVVREGDRWLFIGWHGTQIQQN